MRQLKISRSITNRESESLERYLREINRIELISAEKEMELFPLIRKGDRTALDLLTQANLRFVVSVAKQYQHQGLSLSDLINEGNIGLINAAKKFDETKGFKFISYAVWWIRQGILQALANDSQLIRIPHNKRVLGNQIHKANALLEQTLERPATAEELAEVLNMDAEEISLRMNLPARHVSLDTPLSDNEENSLLDVLENKDGVHGYEQTSFDGSLKTEVERVMQTLTARQKEILCCFFGISITYPMSLDEIASKYDLTRERVRQIKDKALMLLRKKETYHLLKGFLGA
ncbi:MAG TPA: RNA polymerase sigma factor RpoD/SigA [Chitinophagaceae bacterium]|jgi:RNA polymerase primary sigma factor|nr:RNA polymerase sigma factor RpoD/SigA [Chitinophagaceae bacterium]